VAPQQALNTLSNASRQRVPTRCLFPKVSQVLNTLLLPVAAVAAPTLVVAVEQVA
jgi:hypothetical protein